ncbi:hypothetical protein PoB_001265500 [Plakobranchus ocellatus]|uniref:Uncharacterized protein n=1 Tax=Plakobranchus ocellatus TaxID=259542 RepID=A0AAV3YSN8_9GAST|nr:hypothetical protein PoB_001265500 [Plakobranchus ocellatus]
MIQLQGNQRLGSTSSSWSGSLALVREGGDGPSNRQDKIRQDKTRQEDERKLHVREGFEPAPSLAPTPCQTEEPSEQANASTQKIEESDSGHSRSHSIQLEYTGRK